MRSGRAFAVVVCGVFGALAPACNDSTPNLLVQGYDAGSDATAVAEAGPRDAALFDDVAYLGGPCVDDAQCDDGVACTFDSCDQAVARCQNVPDDTRCSDGVYCDGAEICDPLHGCVAGAPVTCDDGDPCTLDQCVEATESCDHAPRDLDQDGDPDDHCASGHDCDDLDPTVSSLHAEVCKNGKDDNCNGVVDEMPCVVATGDVCSTAIAVPANATTTLSTVGDDKDYASSCDLSTPGAIDAVASVVVPPGANVDLDVWVTTPGAAASVAIQSSCGDASTELACGSGGTTAASAVRARARNVAPGTYYVIATTAGETHFDLEVTLLAPTPPATNVSCATAEPVVTDTPFPVSIIDPPTNLASACTAETGELTYAFTLPETSDVDVYAATTQGSGTPVVGLRDAHCTDPSDELFCDASPSLPLYARALPAGTYVLTVAATSPIDATVDVRTAAPTTAPADQTCAAPPAAAIDATTNVDLSNLEAAVTDGCDPGGPTAAFDLPLATLSDVLLVARFPEIEVGGVSLDTPACNAATRLSCATGETPVRTSARSVAPGDYRVVVTDELGAEASLTALVRDALPPTTVGGAETCALAVAVPPGGGFFTGDTTGETGNYMFSCDAAGQNPGAPDEVLSLTLTEPQRVVLDMEGSTYTTLLDVYQGPSCPGVEVMSACYVGFEGPRSFLDLELDAGQYWLIVSGYAGAKGQWNLDVRVVPP